MGRVLQTKVIKDGINLVGEVGVFDSTRGNLPGPDSVRIDRLIALS